ncbi:MAG: hypothetical protein KDC54_22930, partial [Lewinella sp.]|nr:hypothetical protein [Lewinella sp.]
MQRIYTLFALVILAAVIQLAMGLGDPGIIGTITFSNGDPTAGVTVTFSGDTNAQSTTDANGDYTFNGNTADLVPGNSVTITPSVSNLNCDPTCIDLYDFWLMSAHILGVSPIASPWGLLAADIDNNAVVNTTDLIQLQ